MPEKIKEWPEKGELVIGTVVKVNPFSAIIYLDEYEKKEGMIHISEVAGKWVRDIRKFVKVGQKIVTLVLYVNKQRGDISLSLKRVKRFDAEEKKREYKREQKAEKMLSELAKKLNMDVEEARKTVGSQIKDIYGEMFKAFQKSMTKQGYDLLVKKGIPEKWAKAIKEVANEQMGLKEKTMKGMIELKCLKPDGVKIIKKVLNDSKEKYKIDIKYISAPRYSVYFETKDPKAGEKKLKEALEHIVKSIENLGGQGKFKVV